jgi:transcription initiation factor TFIID subunit 11
MYNPQTHNHFPLALPTAYQHLSIPQPVTSASASYAQSSDPPPKKRKINSNAFHRPTHDDRELDERDDVADDDLVAAPVARGGRGEIDENYDEEEEAEVEVEGDAEEDGLEQGVAREEGAATTMGASGKVVKKKRGLDGLDVDAIKAKGHIMKGNQMYVSLPLFPHGPLYYTLPHCQ